MYFNTVDFESMLAAKEAAYWSFWTMLGTWVAGLATFSAVVLSLFLSTRSTRVIISGTVGLKDKVITGASSIPRVLTIRILNKGIPTAYISNIGWKVSTGNLFERFFLRKNKYFHQIFQPSDVSTQCWPAKIDYGEDVYIIIEQPLCLNSFAHELSLPEIKSLRFAITNSFGRTIYIKPDDFLINEIIRVKNESTC